MSIPLRLLLSLLVVLAIPTLAVAETFVYVWGSAWEAPVPLVLLVGGLALIAVGMTLRKWLQPPEVPPVEPIEAAPIGRLSDLPRESGEVPQESANPSGLPADNSEGNSFQPANPRGRHRHVRRRDGQVAEKLACVKG